MGNFEYALFYHGVALRKKFEEDIIFPQDEVLLKTWWEKEGKFLWQTSLGHNRKIYLNNRNAKVHSLAPEKKDTMMKIIQNAEDTLNNLEENFYEIMLLRLGALYCECAALSIMVSAANHFNKK